MKTIQTTVYKFSELSDEVKEKAIDNNRDINVSYDWWEFTYEDAANIGIKIQGFDIDRGSYCQIEFKGSALETAQKIVKEHGESCETYKTAKSFLTDYDKLVEKHSDGKDKTKVSEENEYDFDNEADELEEEFKKSISEDYRIILSNEYDYQTTDEAIKETIEANDYDFTIDGKIY